MRPQLLNFEKARALIQRKAGSSIYQRSMALPPSSGDDPFKNFAEQRKERVADRRRSPEKVAVLLEKMLEMKACIACC